MKKTLIIGLMGIMCLIGSTTAQNSFNLPYSQFGIGSSDIPYNMPMAVRTGGTIYTRSGNNYINPFNPASYGGIEKESFVFDMGFNIQLNTQRTGDNSLYDANGNVGYLAIGLPVTRWWKLAGGLMPYSSVSYNSVTQQQDTNTYGTMNTRYQGQGGVSQIFLGSAFNIPAWKGAQIQAGFNVNYLTGRIQRTISYEFADNTVTHWVNSRRLKETRLNNVLFDFGLQMRQAVGENYTLALGLTYKPYQDMKTADNALIYTYESSSEQLIDTIFPAQGEDVDFDSRLEQPHTFGIGLSIERNKRWQVAFDATFSKWHGLRYTEDEGHNIFGHSSLGNGAYSRYAMGFERLGDMDASTYWGRISWSLGAHAERGSMYLSLADGEHQLNAWGLGAGMSLPMRKGRSLLTISVGYDNYGSSDVLMRESVTFGIAVSSCERWFVKRKYN
jgi:hypothetical protein